MLSTAEFCKGWSSMAESEARDWVLNLVEDLHWRAGSMRFWVEELEQIDLETCGRAYIPTVTVAWELINQVAFL